MISSEPESWPIFVGQKVWASAVLVDAPTPPGRTSNWKPTARVRNHESETASRSELETGLSRIGNCQKRVGNQLKTRIGNQLPSNRKLLEPNRKPALESEIASDESTSTNEPVTGNRDSPKRIGAKYRRIRRGSAGGLGSGPSSQIHHAILRVRASPQDTPYQDFRVFIGGLGSGSSSEIHHAILRVRASP